MKMKILDCLLVFKLLLQITSADDGVRVMKMNTDGVQRSTTYASYDSNLTFEGDVTICLRFKISVIRLLTAVLYLLVVRDSDEDPVSFEVYFEKIRTKFGGYGKFYPLPTNLETNTWYFYCQVRDMTSQEGRVYLNGQLIAKENISFQTDGLPRRVFIGQDEFQAPYSFSGRLTQVNVWSRILTDQEIQNISNCESNLEGDLVYWSGQWNLTNANFEITSLDKFCSSVSSSSTPVSLPTLQFSEAVTVCKGLGGIIKVPKTIMEIQKELQVFEANEACERQWAGLSDAETESVWYNYFTNEAMNSNLILFRENNPDGDKYQNCLRLHPKGLEDTECKKQSCAACYVPSISIWTLRGICEDEERMYYLNLEPNPLGFKGYGEYAVKLINEQWTWYNTVTNVTMATLALKDEQLNYPIGRLLWELKEPICAKRSGATKELTLSSCGDKAFTCSDGSCVPFGSRCDLKFDCTDKSDESMCDIINFPSDYRSELPPRPTSKNALPIAINVTIDTLNVDTTTMLVSVSYNLRITWFDNRLTYNNLKVLTRLNTVAETQVSKLWRPSISFINTDDIQRSIVDADSFTTIFRSDPVYKPDLTNAFEVEIYDGNTNKVSTSRKYFTIYTCNFDLILYPFDIQNCFLMLQILSASNEYLIFNEKDSFVKYLGTDLLIEYGIGTIDLTVDNSTEYCQAKIKIELIRRYGYAMLNIYIPSLTLLVISYITLYFRPTIFEVRVMTALTSLLVLATLFTQVSTSLPKTSYFKMVDIWLLFCIMVIFFIIILHTLIDLQVDYGSFSNLSINGPVHAWPPSDKKDANIISDFKGGKATVLQPMRMNNGCYRLWNDVISYILELNRIVYLSKLIIFLIFLVFNVIYWGILGYSSGLVYQYKK